MLTRPAAASAMPFADFPVYGAVLLALAAVQLDHGDARAAESGARMTALAERFGFPCGFQPTMSPVRAKQVAERADRAACEDAVSSYAALDDAALSEAALAALTMRQRTTAWDRA